MTTERLPALAPGEGVRRNVAAYQLRLIIERAKAGGYGRASAAILERSQRELEAATARRT